MSALVIEGQDISEVMSSIDMDRRPGGFSIQAADSSKIRKELGWIPGCSMEKTIGNACQWRSSHPEESR